MKDFETIESVCTYCGVGCDIAAEVSDNKIQKIFAYKDGVVSGQFRAHGIRPKFFERFVKMGIPITEHLSDLE